MLTWLPAQKNHPTNLTLHCGVHQGIVRPVCVRHSPCTWRCWHWGGVENRAERSGAEWCEVSTPTQGVVHSRGETSALERGPLISDGGVSLDRVNE